MDVTVWPWCDTRGKARSALARESLSVGRPSVAGTSHERGDHVIIDCQACPVRELHCDDCMVGALLSPSAAADLPLDAAERAAVTAFVASGLVSPAEASRVRARREPWATHARAVG